MNFEITRRDLDVLEFLAKFKVATINQIHHFHFKNCQKKNASKRLLKLGEMGLIQRNRIIPVGQKELIYSLSPKGAEVFLETKFKDNSNFFQLGSEVPAHDLEVVKLAFGLKQLSMCQDLITENEVSWSGKLYPRDIYRAFTDLRADAFMRMGKGDDEVWGGIEFELSAKSPEKLARKVQAYQSCPYMAFCFYFCENTKVLNRLDRIVRELGYRDFSKVYSGIWKSTKAEVGKVTLRNISGDILEFNFSSRI